MQISPSPQDAVFRATLASYGLNDHDYWSFRGRAAREHAHAYFQYPAMMVPQMQRDLLNAARSADPKISLVYDPFVGSGTALTESMMLGFDFIGHDINPLAILLCRTKAMPFFDAALESKLADVLERVKRDDRLTIESTFDGLTKWFRRDVAIALSRLRRAIRCENALWARRFFWIALAETVRLSSNSRTSTFKLHIRPEDERDSRSICSQAIFKETAERNLVNLRTAKSLLTSNSLLDRGRYTGYVRTILGDASDTTSEDVERKADFLLTSPPYGDNVTTIPYGQHSYLPLQWIDLADIGDDVSLDFIRSTHEIDSRSLGGSRVLSDSVIAEMKELSPTLAQYLKKLRNSPADRAKRVTAFCRDLHTCIAPILGRLKKRAYMAWIVGNRMVGGSPVPLDQILTEFLLSHSATSVALIRRVIPTKRMAVRNDVSCTMGRETILVFRKE